MKRVTQLGIAVLFGLSSGAVLAGTTSQSASAATWHRGAPSALKGKWRTKLYRSTGSNKRYGGYYTRTTFYVGSTATDGANDFYSKSRKLVNSGCGWGINHSLRWRYLGTHHYRLESINASSNSYDMIYTMYVRGHKAKLNGMNQVFYKVK